MLIPMQCEYYTIIQLCHGLLTLALWLVSGGHVVTGAVWQYNLGKQFLIGSRLTQQYKYFLCRQQIFYPLNFNIYWQFICIRHLYPSIIGKEGVDKMIHTSLKIQYVIIFFFYFIEKYLHSLTYFKIFLLIWLGYVWGCECQAGAQWGGDRGGEMLREACGPRGAAHHQAR